MKPIQDKINVMFVSQFFEEVVTTKKAGKILAVILEMKLQDNNGASSGR